MKYVQPYGISDPNAAYINGNPSTGTMGSIPPAASIEHPMREIVAMISASGFTPTDADLVQLAKSIQSGKVNYAADAGTANQLAVTLAPAVTSYFAGLRVIVKVAAANTGPSTINVNAIGAQPIVHGDLTALAANELLPGKLVELVHDGAGRFQMVSSHGGVIQMTAGRSVYVHPTIGHDTNYDGSQPTVSGSKGPFQTIQRALSEMTKFNLGGWVFAIYLADGIYANTAYISFPPQNGSGAVWLIGNNANPQACRVYNTAAGTTFLLDRGGNWAINGVSLQATAPYLGDAGNCMVINASTTVQLTAIAFGPCTGSHLIVGNAAFCQMNGPVTIWGDCGESHVQVTSNGIYANYNYPYPALTITAAISLGTGGFFNVGQGAYAMAKYASINFSGPGSAVGPKFFVYGNGVLDVQGAGQSYLPGSTITAPQTGGQYL